MRSVGAWLLVVAFVLPSPIRSQPAVASDAAGGGQDTSFLPSATNSSTPTNCISQSDLPIVNPGFEDGASSATGWAADVRPGFTLQRLTGNARDGAASVSIQGPLTAAPDYPNFNQVVPLGVGSTVKVSAWISTASVDQSVQFGGASIVLDLLDASGNAVAAASSGSVTGDSSWVRITASATRIAANVRAIRIKLMLRGHGTAWFDSISAAQSNAPSQQPTSTVTLALKQQLHSPFLGFGMQHNPWIYGPANPVLDEQDYDAIEGRVAALRPPLVATFFSTRWWELDGWSADEAANRNTARVTSEALDGNASVRIQGATGGPLDYRGVSQVLLAPTTGSIRVAASVKTQGVAGPAGETPGAYLAVDFFGADAKAFAGLSSALVSDDSGWTPIAAAGRIPDGTAFIKVSLMLHGYGAAWFDTVSARRTDTGEQIALVNASFEDGASFDTPRMRDLLRVLRLYQSFGSDINLRMYWPYDWAPAELPALASQVRDLLVYVRSQGLSGVRYVTLFTEPELFSRLSFASLVEADRLVRTAIQQAGLPIKVVGIDECCSDAYFYTLAQQLGSSADALSYHDGADYRDPTPFILKARDRLAYVAASGAGRPVFIWEFNVIGNPAGPSLPGETVPGTNVIDTLDGALGLARASIAAMNEGISGLSYWELVDTRVGPGSDIPHWGLLKGQSDAWRPRPIYYAYGLFTRLTRSGAAVLEVSPDACEQSLPATAVLNPDGTRTVYVVNPWSSPVDVHLTALPSTWSPKRYVVTGSDVASLSSSGAPFAYGYATPVVAGELQDRLPARSVVAYSDVSTAGLPNPPSPPCDANGAPTSTIYLPNVTRRLGGPDGWVTPFYVQNAGTDSATIEASFYDFGSGVLAACHKTSGVAPGASVLDDPNAASDLTDWKQYSVVVRSYGAPVIATVNQMQRSGGRIEALSYTGSSAGASTIYVPNVTRRFYGYDVPLIIQNLGPGTASVTATFASFDGNEHVTIPLTIGSGLSGVIDPDYTPGLSDGTQYAVKVTATQPIAVVANAHDEAIGPVAFSHNGLASGANTIYAPYATKGETFSNVVIQNVGVSTVTATLTFKPTSGGPPQIFMTPPIPGGGSRAFDVRFADGVALTGATPCGSTATSTCLGNGDYGLTISAGGSIAAVILPNSASTAGAYLAATTASSHVLLPVVARDVSGWNATIWIMAVSTSAATLRYYTVGAGRLAATQTVALVPGGTTRVDPRTVAGLTTGEYSVVVDASGPITAAVSEFNPAPGDGLMVYEGAPN